ncbi:hypothetical protein [Alkalihalobacterium sp. APHAB7]|uniref:hypothetical protein n=1 Tax=Alkalihalobacterium sp. APHAB7 TaxID=3402081 RepID=UPI003AB0CB97
MKQITFKLSLVTLFLIVIIFSVDFVNHQFSNSNGGYDIEKTIEMSSEVGKVLAADKQLINSDWIEKGFEGQLDHIEFQLGTTKETILSGRGDAMDTGFYEGGEFFRYDDATFFINPETDRLVAIALSTEGYELDAAKLKEVLGSPDVSERNEMEGLWMYEYYLDKYSLIFEAEEEGGKILFTWLRERL